MKKNRRIAIFLPSLSGGGAEKMMVNLAKGFVKKGLKIDLVLANATGPYISMVPKEVNIIDLKSKRMILSLFKLAKYLKEFHPKTLLVTLESANVIALIANSISRSSTKIVIRIPNNISQQIDNANNFKNKLILYIGKYLYRKADKVVAISNGVAEDTSKFTKIPSDKIHVIYNPVVSEYITKKAVENVEDEWFLEGDNIPIILGVGRLTKQKDFSTLIKAFSIVLEKKDARLLIIGEGEERIKLEELIKEKKLEGKAKLIGFVDNPYKYMKRSSVFVLSSLYEGFGNVLVEAMACGTPIVSTDCKSGPSEILENGNYGKLVNVGDWDRMAVEILSTIEAETDKDKLIMRSNNFKIDYITEQYLDVLI